MRRSEQGFSLMEITVVLAIVSVIMIVVYGLIEETLRVTLFNESHDDLTILSQKAVNTLQAEILQTKLAFQEDALGSSYRSALVMPSDITVMTNSLMPVFDADGELVPDDAATRFTGNALLVARQLAPISIMYDHDAKSGTPDIEFLADRYRFEYFYLAKKTVKSFGGSGQTLDLMMTQSGEYADYFQLSSVGSTALKSLSQKVINAGIARAWDPGQAIGSAFYQLSDATDGTFNSALSNPTIATLKTTSLLPGLMGGRVSGRIDYSVGFIPASPATPFPIPSKVRVFAQADASKPTFPSGFEVKIVGPARYRRVMTRVVLMGNYLAKKYESQEGFVVTAARF
jgi:prepilin-type N-terminal cleavage/methylation domain-containing protein